MENYFRAVTLGAFTWKNEERIALFFEHIQRMGYAWLLLHFVLLTFCLNFPVTFAMARLSPFEMYNRVYGENVIQAITGKAADQAAIDEFNLLMFENGYGKNTLLPLLGMGFGLTLIIQAVFYLCTAFFLGLSRMHTAPLSFHDRLGLAFFSSTLPVLAAALFGLFLPTVHIIVFYFIVMFYTFQRSTLCPNG
jgi:maltodextrin utilization protein YvdJ